MNAEKAAAALPEHLANSSIHKLYKLGKILSEDITGTLYESGVPAKGKDAAVYVLAPECTIASRKLIRIDHPNICRAHRVLTLKGGTSAVVIDRPEGEPIVRFASKAEPFGLKESISAVLQLLSALHGIHTVGKTARNLNVNNIFLHNDRNGNLRLKLAGIGMEGRGVNLKAPHYFSPERLMDVDKGDPRTDLWAAGAVLYHLCYGKPPFEADDPVNSAQKSMLESPRFDGEGRDIPDALVAVIKRALDRDERKRYQTASEMVGDLLPLRDKYNEPMSEEVTAALRNSYPPPPSNDSASRKNSKYENRSAQETRSKPGARTKDATIEYGAGDNADHGASKPKGTANFFGTPISPRAPVSVSGERTERTGIKSGRKTEGTLLGIPAISVTAETNRAAATKPETEGVLSARSLLGSEEDIKQLESDLDFLENREDAEVPTLVISGNNLAALVDSAEKSTPDSSDAADKHPSAVTDKKESALSKKKDGSRNDKAPLKGETDAVKHVDKKSIDNPTSEQKRPGSLVKEKAQNRKSALFAKSKKQERVPEKPTAEKPAEKKPAIRSPELRKLGVRHTDAGKELRKIPVEKAGDRKEAAPRAVFAKPVVSKRTEPRPVQVGTGAENPVSPKRTQLGMTVPEAFRKGPEKSAPKSPALPTTSPATTATQETKPPALPPQKPIAPPPMSKPIPTSEGETPRSPALESSEIALPIDFGDATSDAPVERPVSDDHLPVPLLEPVQDGKLARPANRIKIEPLVTRVKSDKRLLIGLSAGLLIGLVAVVSAALLSGEETPAPKSAAARPTQAAPADSPEPPTESAPPAKPLAVAAVPTPADSAVASTGIPVAAPEPSKKPETAPPLEKTETTPPPVAAASVKPKPPAVPETVVIAFQNIPEESKAKADGKPIDLPATLPKSKNIVKFAIEAEGYKPLRVGVVPDRDRDVPIRMQKAPEKSGRPKHRASKKKKKKSGTLVSNPFTK